MPKHTTDVALNVGLAAVYVIAARAGVAFEPAAGFASLVWPASGMSLAALLLFGARLAPGIFAGALLANLLNGAPLPLALAFAAGNTGEALIGARLLQRFGFRNSLDTVHSVLALIGLAAVVSTVVSATVGATALLMAGRISGRQYPITWSSWWIGDLVSDLVVASAILVWATKPRGKVAGGATEGLALGALIVVIGFAALFDVVPFVPHFITPFHQASLLLVVLLWASVRFGVRGATTAAFLVSAMAIGATILGHGPFVRPEVSSGLFSLQTFMAGIVATCLIVAATTTEKRVAFEGMRRARLEAANANLAKSEFLAVMSHELRTPLNAIAGFSELLRSVHGPLNDKQADDVERIARNERKLLEVIDQVLGFVSAEKGAVHIESRTLEVIEVLDAAETLVRPELTRKHFVLQRDVSQPSLTVQADPKSLQQILVSLLSNAAKFTQDGGSITIGADREGINVRIWVADDGIGIPGDEITRVFEPFFQSDRGPTRRSTGIGLGLTIARDLARRMEGELTLASKPGEGTTASIVLPA